LSSDETKIDKAWRKIFAGAQLSSKLNQHGFFTISANELKKLSGGYEPRLLAKIDFSRSRPKVFIEEEVNVLPLNRGSYVVFRDYENVSFYHLPRREAIDSPKKYLSQRSLSDFDLLKKHSGLCESEAEALEVAFISSLLSTFCETDNLILTRRGRFGTGKFPLKLPVETSEVLAVDRAQIEVDAIYENQHTVVIVEAKRCLCVDINTRQLFFPYQWVKSRTKKTVKTVLLCYENGLFRLTELKFGNRFCDVAAVKQDFHLIDEDYQSELNFDVLLRYSPSPTEPETSFPQADTMDKVIGVFFAMVQGTTDSDELARLFDFDVRQSNYHKSAVEYLGLFDDGHITRTGLHLLKEQHRVKRTEIIFKCMMARIACREVFLLLKSRGFSIDDVSIADIEKIILKRRKDITGSTLTRRARTIRAWFKWLLANMARQDQRQL